MNTHRKSVKFAFKSAKSRGEEFVTALPGNTMFCVGYTAGFTTGVVTGTTKAAVRGIKTCAVVLGGLPSRLTPKSVKDGFHAASPGISPAMPTIPPIDAAQAAAEVAVDGLQPA